LHRDIEAGIMSGEMEQNGFYGVEVELYGFAYKEVDDVKVRIGEDEVQIALELYNMYRTGRIVSDILIKSKRIYEERDDFEIQKQKMKDEFFVELMSQKNQENMIKPCKKQYNVWTRKDVFQKISGFSYMENNIRKSMANGYFPCTIRAWLDKKKRGYDVKDIILEDRCQDERMATQLRNFKQLLLNS